MVPGEHAAIIDPALFDAVQDLLRAIPLPQRQQRSKADSLLTGLLFDDRGNRMSPSFSTNAACVTVSMSLRRSLLAGKMKRVRCRASRHPTQKAISFPTCANRFAQLRRPE